MGEVSIELKPPAPHGRRALAWLVDSLIVGIAALLITSAFKAGEVLLLVQGKRQLSQIDPTWFLIVALVYFVVYHSSSVWLTRTTAGKAMFGLRIIRGERSSLLWALGRSTVGYAVIDVFGIGTLFALGNSRHRCLHDLVFGSEVVLEEASLGLWRGLIRFERERQAAREEKTKPLESFKVLRGFVDFLIALASPLTLLSTLFFRGGAASVSAGASAAAAAAPTTLSAGATAGVAAATTAVSSAIAAVVLGGPFQPFPSPIASPSGLPSPPPTAAAAPSSPAAPGRARPAPLPAGTGTSPANPVPSASISTPGPTSGPSSPPSAEPLPPGILAPSFTSFAVPIAGSQPFGVTKGPDGNLWFTDPGANKIGKMTPSGTVQEFTITRPGVQPAAITSGPDGNLWFVELQGGSIGRITPSGSITEFPVQRADGIVAGPDGNLWFTVYSGGIGRITPDGDHAVYPLGPNTQPMGITVGPDRNIWFTEFGPGGNKIGTITTSGVIKEFPIPTKNSQPSGIVTGPDGNLWFTERSLAANKIGRITPQGDITEFPVPTPGSMPFSIVSGPDGNLWFTEFWTHRIGRITPSGLIHDFMIQPLSRQPRDITVGPDNNLWLASVDRSIVRVRTR